MFVCMVYVYLNLVRIHIVALFIIARNPKQQVLIQYNLLRNVVEIIPVSQTADCNVQIYCNLSQLYIYRNIIQLISFHSSPKSLAFLCYEVLEDVQDFRAYMQVYMHCILYVYKRIGKRSLVLAALEIKINIICIYNARFIRFVGACCVECLHYTAHICSI